MWALRTRLNTTAGKRLAVAVGGGGLRTYCSSTCQVLEFASLNTDSAQ